MKFVLMFCGSLLYVSLTSLASGLPPNLESAYVRHPLHLAVFTGHNEEAQRLLIAGANPNEFSPYTPLMLAARQGAVSMIELLVAHKADLELSHSNGNNALMYALFNRKLEAACKLIELGANVNPSIVRDYTPLWWAISYQNEDLTFMLIQRGAALNDFLDAPMRAWYITILNQRGLQWVENISSLQALNALHNSLFMAKIAPVFPASQTEKPSATMPELASKLSTAIAAHFKPPAASLDTASSVTQSTQAGSSSDARQTQPMQCCVCQEAFTPTQYPAQGLANCTCVICPECETDYMQQELKKETRHQCPSCHQNMHADALRRHHQSEEEVANWYREHQKRILGALPNWEFCKTRNCPNGMVINNEDQHFFICALCTSNTCLACQKYHLGKCKKPNLFEVHQIEASKRYIRELAKDTTHFRPCPYCGILTERIEGCNSMQCASCKQEWHWNLGKVAKQHDRVTSVPLYRPDIALDFSPQS